MIEMIEQEDWRASAVKLANTGVMSRREIACYLNVRRSTCLDYLRAYYNAMADAEERVAEMYDDPAPKDNHDNSRILFISDMHVPYHHPDTITFLKSLKERYNPTRVICLGDELDKHAMSFHDHDPELYSAGHELEAARPVIKELEMLFPLMDIIDSNHGSLHYRKAKHHGIPRHYIRSYNEILGVGKGWVWHNDLTITLPDGQQVYIHHGKSADAVKTSQAMSMSHVCGHFHESFGLKYWANPNGLFWAMNTGCLINDKSLAFQYNNVNLKRPIIGTGLLIDGVPVLEAMPL